TGAPLASIWNSVPKTASQYSEAVLAFGALGSKVEKATALKITFNVPPLRGFSVAPYALPIVAPNVTTTMAAKSAKAERERRTPPTLMGLRTWARLMVCPCSGGIHRQAEISGADDHLPPLNHASVR